MSQKSVKEILNEIRDYRNRELVEDGDNRVFYTRVVAMVEGERTGKRLYRVIEEYSTGENESQVRELFYEYEKNGPELIAMLEPERFEGILPIGEPIISKQEQEEWEITLEDIENGREKARKQAKEQAQKLGIDEEALERLTELEIDKAIDEKIDEQNDERSHTDSKEHKEDKETVIPSEQAKKQGIIGMNQIPLNQRVGVHGQTLKSELGLDKDEYADVESLEIIPTYKLAYLGENVNKNPFTVIGRRTNGEIVVFPEDVCRAYRGENNEITKLDGKDDSVTREKSNCMFEFPGKKATLAIDQKSPYGIVDASLAYNTMDNDGRVALDLQNRYEDGIRHQDRETREIVDPYHGVYHTNEILNEVNSHPEKEIEDGELKKEDADGKDYTESHEHVHTELPEFERAVQEVMDSVGLEREDSREAIKAKLIEKVENEKMTLQEATQETIDEETRDFEESRGANTRNR